MYQEFYGLKEKPFPLTPDPQFLYLSEGHRTATDSLLYGIDQKMGFMVLTGDIGTGKTTTCRTLLERLGKNVKTAVIFNSFLNEGELLKSILQDLGVSSKKRSKKEQIDELNQFLIHQVSKGENVALLIDEAQNLSIPVLEELRMLSNLETEKEKILQIVLFGQLELDQKLQAAELKQLNQRVAIRHRLLPLTQTETEGYIHHRLMVAGTQGNITFSRLALKGIYHFSKGTPRLINLICDRALLAGFVDQTYHIKSRIIKKAKRSLLGEEVSVSSTSFLAWRKRLVPLHISLFMIFLAFFTSLIVTSYTTKGFVWQKIQSITLQAPRTSEEPMSKITNTKPSKYPKRGSSGGRS